MRVFCLPAVQSWEGRGVTPWSVRRTLRLTLRATLGSKAARLVLRGLSRVARRAQRTQPRPCIRIGNTTRHQRATRLREVVSRCRRLRAQHAPRTGVEVAAPDVRPPSPVRARPRCLPQCVRLTLMSGTAATTSGQFGAPGYRARGAGSSGRHGYFPYECGCVNRSAKLARARDHSPGFARVRHMFRQHGPGVS